MRMLDDKICSIARPWWCCLLAFTLVVSCFIAQAVIGSAPSDSSAFRYIGWQMGAGARCFVDVWDHKGPMVFIFNALGFAFGCGPGVVYCLVWVAVTMGVFWLGRRHSSLVGGLAALLFALSGLGIATGVFLDNVEITAAVFMVVAAQLFLRKPVWWTHLAIGVCIGGAFLTKPNLVSGGAAMVLVAGVRAIRDRRVKAFLTFGFWSGLGFAAMVGGVTLGFALQGAGKAMWDAMLFYNAFEYASHGTISWGGWWLAYLQRSVFCKVPGWWMIPSYLTMLIVGILGAWSVRGWGGFLMVWALLETFAAFMAKQFYGHYLLMPLVPLSVLVAIGCVKTEKMARGFAWLLIGGVAGLFLIAIGTGVRSAIIRRDTVERANRMIAGVIPQGQEVACFAKDGGAEMMLRNGNWSRQQYQFGVWFWKYVKPERGSQIAADLLVTLRRPDIRHFIFEGGCAAEDYFAECPELVDELHGWQLAVKTDFAIVYMRRKR